MNVKNADLEKVAKINYPFNGPETDFIIEEDSKSGHPVATKWSAGGRQVQVLKHGL